MAEVTTNDVNAHHMTAEQIKAEMELTRAKISLFQQRLSDLSDRLFWEEWKILAWDDVKYSLLEHNQSSLIVSQKYGAHKTHATLNSKNELIIGGYQNNDHYPRGCEMYVRKDYGAW